MVTQPPANWAAAPAQAAGAGDFASQPPQMFRQAVTTPAQRGPLMMTQLPAFFEGLVACLAVFWHKLACSPNEPFQVAPPSAYFRVL